MNALKKKALIGPGLSLRQAMASIDSTGLTIALVVDDGGRLLGTVTDGDIRRAILAGKGLETPVSAVMRADPVTVEPDTDPQTLRRMFVDSTLKHIPVVDRDKRVLDILLVHELLGIPLSNPDITNSERQAVLDVLNTTDLSLGPKVVEFERRMAAYAERRFGVAVNSGTSGLHLVVKSMGLGAGDEVITTPFSFIASSNCLLYEDVRPVFVDIEPDTYNIDPALIEAAITPRTKAVLAVDVFGQPARYDEIGRIAAKHGLRVISDCCESIGAGFQGRKAGSFGEAGVFAFYPNKQITTGEGGVIVTDDEEIARLCRSYRNQGRGEKGGWLSHVRLGYNYRLSDISCALGIAQFDRLGEILAKRDRVAKTYGRLLADFPDVELPHIRPEVGPMSWFVYVIRLARRYTRADRDRVMNELNRLGVGVNAYFQPIHLQPFYIERFGYKPGDFPLTEAVSDRTLALPFHNNLDEATALAVVSHLKSALRRG